LAATRHADPELRGVVCDVSQEAQVRALFAQASDFLGGLDILVNSAGVAGPMALVEGMAFAHWRQCLAVNLDATSLRALAATPLLRAQGSGSIINLSSTAGQYGFPRRAPYAAAKWAIQGFTRTFRLLDPDGIGTCTSNQAKDHFCSSVGMGKFLVGEVFEQ